MNQFSRLGLSQPVMQAIEELGFIQPTPIQSDVIPRLLQEDIDLVGLAQTGTGKTAAFGLPLIERVDVTEKYTQALVLCPTRELCQQVTNELLAFGKYRKGLQVSSVYGGADIEKQIREVKKGAQIIVATPGRLRDLIRRKAVRLEEIGYVVLDEADEMLNMGFKEEIDDILQNTPEEKRTWLFSATMPAEVRRIAMEYMTDPLELSAGEPNTGNEDIDHQFVLVRPNEKYEVLRRFLDFDPGTFALVFCRTRVDTQKLADQLTKDGYRADALHGDLSQSQRDRVMAQFRARHLQVLIATDVAARGLDVQDISHVFHFNIPDDLAFYTHRSGRTGRAGSKGVSIVLTHPKDRPLLKQLEKRLRVAFTPAHVPAGREICEQRLLGRIGKLRNASVDEELKPFLPAVFDALEDLSREELIGKITALAFDRSLRSYLHRPDFQQSGDATAKPARKPVKTIRLFINVGMMDVHGKGEFINLLCSHCRIDGSALGKIEMHKKHTFFDLDESIAPKVIQQLNNSNLDGRTIRINRDEIKSKTAAVPFRKGGKKKATGR